MIWGHAADGQNSFMHQMVVSKLYINYIQYRWDTVLSCYLQ